MPDFVELDHVQIPLLGNSIAVGVAALLHIAFAGLAVGYMLVAPLAEAAGRTRPWYTEVAHAITKFTLVTYTVSLVLAIIMVELFVGLFPLTNSWLFNQFRVPLLLAAGAFLLQLLALYPYYHFWDALRAWNVRVHLALGMVAAMLMLIWVGILDAMGSYMLTPVEGDGPWSVVWNPTWLPLAAHRFIGNFVIAGYALAGYAAWRMRSAPDDRQPYYATLLKGGFLVGLVTLLLQPAFGLLYADSIETAAPEAYAQLVRGPYRPMLYVQFTLIGLLFLASQLWLAAAQQTRSRTALALTAAAVAAMIAASAHPALRRPITFLLVAGTIWTLYRARGVFAGAETTAPSALRRPIVHAASVVLGAAALLTYLTMGTIRETARRPDTVRGLISLQEEATAPAADRARPAPARAEDMVSRHD